MLTARTELIHVIVGLEYRGLVTIRMLYLMFVRLTGWVALLARSAALEEAELLVLCQEVEVLRGAAPPGPRLDWADRMVIACGLPEACLVCERHRLSSGERAAQLDWRALTVRCSPDQSASASFGGGGGP